MSALARIDEADPLGWWLNIAKGGAYLAALNPEDEHKTWLLPTKEDVFEANSRLLDRQVAKLKQSEVKVGKYIEEMSRDELIQLVGEDTVKEMEAGVFKTGGPGEGDG